MIKRNLLPQSITSDASLLRLGHAQQNQLGPVIRCLVWNIWKAKHPRWLDDFTHLSDDRDLLILQEAVSNAPSDLHFAQSTRQEWIMARSHRHPRSGVETGVKTGCVASSVSSQAFASKHVEPIVDTRKMLLQTHYRMNSGEDLMVLNMHAINFVNNKKYSAHIEQLGEVLKSHSGPAILAGDFNTWSKQRFTHFNDVVCREGMVEAVMDRSSRLVHLNKHLDHIFYRGLKLRSVQSLSFVKSSDHTPITATFEQESRDDV